MLTTNSLVSARGKQQAARRRSRGGVFVILAMVLGAVSGALPAHAKVVPNLYRVSVVIENQSQSELKRASREALAELFVRISGHQAVLGDDVIVAAVRDAGRFTKQFSYRRDENAEGEEQLRVVLEFEPSLVQDSLRQAGLPLWSPNRPSVLVWLVVDDGGERRFVGTENDPELVEALRANAQRRGLALQLPLLDLTDLVALSPDDVWQQNYGKLDEASERYGTDTVLAGRVTHLNNDRWLGRWTFRLNGRQLPLDGESDSAADFIAAGLNQVAETLAAEYAIKPVQMVEGGLLMRLTDVRSFVDYARAISYLESVVAVHHANVVSLEDDELILQLVADGEMSQLRQVFSLDKRLQPATDSIYTGPYPVQVSYRWPSDAPPLPVLEEPVDEEGEDEEPAATAMPGDLDMDTQ